jgi:hypothetical protein
LTFVIFPFIPLASPILDLQKNSRSNLYARRKEGRRIISKKILRAKDGGGLLAASQPADENDGENSPAGANECVSMSWVFRFE